MMGLLTSRLAGPIGAGLSVILALSLAWVVISKDATISSLRTDKRELEAKVSNLTSDLTQCRANRLGLELSVVSQNARIKELEAAQAGRLAVLGLSLDAAELATKGAAIRASSILNAKAETLDHCEAADRLILESIP